MSDLLDNTLPLALGLAVLLTGCQVVSGPCKVETSRTTTCEEGGTTVDVIVIPTPIRK